MKMTLMFDNDWYYDLDVDVEHPLYHIKAAYFKGTKEDNMPRLIQDVEMFMKWWKDSDFGKDANNEDDRPDCTWWTHEDEYDNGNDFSCEGFIYYENGQITLKATNRTEAGQAEPPKQKLPPVDIVKLVDRLNAKFAAKRMTIPKDQTWPKLYILSPKNLPPAVFFHEFGLLGGEDGVPDTEAECVKIIVRELERISQAINKFSNVIKKHEQPKKKVPVAVRAELKCPMCGSVNTDFNGYRCSCKSCAHRWSESE